MKKWTRVLCVVLAMIMVLAACGTPAETTTEAPVETTTQAPETTPAPTEPAVVAKDGTYTAEVTGFNLMGKVPVTVEIKDGKMVSISIGENGETNGMPQMVEKYMIPRMLENQTVSVDVITGATSTSAAVRMGVMLCLEQAGADMAQFNADLPKSEAVEEYTVDVVVVGMGGSGTAAALSAAEAGATVLALDKAGKWAGTSAVTSGPMAVNAPSQVAAEYAEWADPITGQKRVKAAGENLVDAEALYQDWINYTTVDGVQHAKIDVIRAVIDGSGEALDWLMTYGFQFDPAKGFVGGKWGIFTSYSGNKKLTEDFFANAYAKYESDLGGKYLLETEATELIVKDGKVAGVKAVKWDGTQVIVNAKNVILATGGFAGSDELMEKYLGESWKLYGMAQNEGTGIEMATSVGAATYNIDMWPMSHFVAPYMIMTAFEAADNDIPYGLVASAEVMVVDQTGTRFINEANIAMNAYTNGAKYYTILSAEQIEILKTQGLSKNSSGRYLSQGGVKADTPLTNIDAVIEKGIEMGFIYKADSLDALVSAIGNEKMSADNLKASVAAYNVAANGGEDALGKAADNFARLGAVNEGSKYYVAITGAPYIYSTCGGLEVNVDMQVINTAGEVIEGLYAVGTDSMGVMFTNTKGYTNYGGVAQGFAFWSGRVAGAHAAGNK
ncbi:MAG: FAD-dependent oxidoreductase [Lachnospiraceae bacterium]|nr:FAD-dependent oxidoreductase [Lachnospiraceae bacterium]